MKRVNKCKVLFVLPVFVISVICCLQRPAPVRADGERAALSVSSDENAPAVRFGECRAAAVFECSSGTLLAGKNENESLPAGHLAKLMTFYLAAEQIMSGGLSAHDSAVCSRLANSQQSPQIWLGIGEKITVDELLRSVSAGNANDACVCLAERLCGTEDDYTALADCKALELDMRSTHFDDCTGLSDKTVSSAADICRLCAELSRLESFLPYFSVRLDSVRGGRAELVSRCSPFMKYRGFMGFKVGFTDASGECAAVCARRADMTLCAVVMGAPDEEALVSQVTEMLDSAFAAYEVYYPEAPEEAAADAAVRLGVKSSCPVEMPDLRPVMIPKGSSREVSCEFEREEKLTAPVSQGDRLGRIVFSSQGRELISSDICAAGSIDRVDIGFTFKRILYNLLNI